MNSIAWLSSMCHEMMYRWGFPAIRMDERVWEEPQGLGFDSEAGELFLAPGRPPFFGWTHAPVND